MVTAGCGLLSAISAAISGANVYLISPCRAKFLIASTNGTLSITISGITRDPGSSDSELKASGQNETLGGSYRKATSDSGKSFVASIGTTNNLAIVAGACSLMCFERDAKFIRIVRSEEPPLTNQSFIFGAAKMFSESAIGGGTIEFHSSICPSAFV